jgi:hypothetical protein
MRTREQIGWDLIRALKKKWGNDGRIVCGHRSDIKPAHSSEVADLLARIPAPRIGNFNRMAAEEAWKRMERRSAAAEYLGVDSSFMTKNFGKRDADGK